MEIISLLTLSWILIVFVVLFFLLPQKLFPSSINTNFVNKIFNNTIYTSLVIILAANLLSKFHLFNWVTLLLCYFVWPTIYWLSKNLKNINSLLREYIISKYLQLLDLLEFDNLQKAFSKYLFDIQEQYSSLLKIYITKINFSNPITILALSFFLITTSFIFTLNFSEPIKELRLPFTEGYQTLLETWQILLGQTNQSKIMFLPAIIAAISSLAATDPLHTVRFFSPLLLCLLVFLVGITIWRVTNYKGVGLVAIYLLGTNIFYWPIDNTLNSNKLPDSLLETIYNIFQQVLSKPLFGEENTLAFIFLLLAINFWNQILKEGRGDNFNRTLVNTLICLILVGLSFPLLLLPTFLTMIVLTILPSLTLLIFSISLIMLVLFFEINQVNNLTVVEVKFILPIALTLLFAAVCQFFIYSTRFIAIYYREPIITVLMVAISLVFLPEQPRKQYLEYDICTRKTLEIAQQFPKKQWLIIAPTEELAISYGYGWYEDLAIFTSKYQDKVKNSEFRFLFSLDTFIFVEKKPFAFFKQEAQYVPFSTLSDASYKNYRSLAGRASLEQQALTLCETYREFHPEVKIYYEDENLRIYFIPKEKP